MSKKEQHTYYHRTAKEEEGSYRIAFVLPSEVCDVWTSKKEKRK